MAEQQPFLGGIHLGSVVGHTTRCAVELHHEQERGGSRLFSECLPPQLQVLAHIKCDFSELSTTEPNWTGKATGASGPQGAYGIYIANWPLRKATDARAGFHFFPTMPIVEPQRQMFLEKPKEEGNTDVKQGNPAVMSFDNVLLFSP
ncbi:hypothetical protein P7K49_021147 [Saguinus oedipus]|uniref:Uncharacterized protein n=1 Tax=Saguinus oedipus TaxID=9490 RepID=A0ABQ9URU1_SAGOE|nr:hypothetical protein P7K49_021147 [Saguinus oedipus]